MRFSIFTPTHDPRWLSAAYKSLLAQAFTDWEWVVVPNGPAVAADVRVAGACQADTRVRVVPAHCTGVGALKQFAAQQCAGEVLVELDHDDALAPNCLARLHAAAHATPDGFYYSDFVSVGPDGRCEQYSKQFGWDHYPWQYDGDELVAMRSLPACARSLCEIFYAPNHVRAWSRTAYERSGGHDPKLAVGDDHDLLCRTYLAGVPFVHVRECLYVYRAHPASTCKTDNPKVMTQQKSNMNKYLYALVYEECRRRGLPKMEIGFDKQRQDADFTYLDLPAYRAECDLTNDFRNALPHKTDKFGCVWVSDVLQRIPREDHAALFNELYRVVAPGGWVLTNTPALDDGEGRVGRGAFQDPSHVSTWSPNNFWYFTHRDYAKHVAGYKGRFQLVRSWVDYPTIWHKANLIPYVHADLCVLKGQHQVGLITI